MAAGAETVDGSSGVRTSPCPGTTPVRPACLFLHLLSRAACLLTSCPCSFSRIICRVTSSFLPRPPSLYPRCPSLTYAYVARYKRQSYYSLRVCPRRQPQARRLSQRSGWPIREGTSLIDPHPSRPRFADLLSRNIHPTPDVGVPHRERQPALVMDSLRSQWGRTRTRTLFCSIMDWLEEGRLAERDRTYDIRRRPPRARSGETQWRETMLQT